MTEIKFNDEVYTEASLGAMEIEDLLITRNLVATNLGVATLKSFKDHATAVSHTWKALVRFQSVVDAEATGADPVGSAKVDKPKKPKKPKAPPKERSLAKSADSKIVKRPTRSKFATIKKIGTHDGSQGRTHRWPNYKDGMTMVDVIEGVGTEPWDVHNWIGQGIMELIDPTDAEYTERRAAWFKKHGRDDPDLVKIQQVADRAAAKVTRDKERVAKAKAKAEKVAEKTAEAKTD